MSHFRHDTLGTPDIPNYGYSDLESGHFLKNEWNEAGTSRKTADTTCGLAFGKNQKVGKLVSIIVGSKASPH